MLRIIRWAVLVALISLLWFSLVYILSSVFLTPASAVDTRKRVFFADWTDSRIDWRISEAVYLWNKNPYVKVTQVKSCQGYTPCVTITDHYAGYERFGFATNSVVGLFWTTDNEFNDSNNIIELYTWPYKYHRLYNPYDFQRISCHELGHFLLQELEHPNRGCLGEDSAKYYPGKVLRSRLSVWR